MFRLLSFISALALLGACTPTLSAKALRFNQGLELNTGKTFAIVAEGEQNNNLEFNHYAELLNRQLQIHGLQQASSLVAADYRVYFSYGSDGGRQFVQSYPDVGLRGGFSSYGSGVGIGIGGPLYDPYRHNRVESYVVYTHRFEMRIENAHSRGRNNVFQGRVVGSGGSQGIAANMPCLIAAMFQDFPGRSGVEQDISLPLTACSR